MLASSLFNVDRTGAMSEYPMEDFLGHPNIAFNHAHEGVKDNAAQVIGKGQKWVRDNPGKTVTSGAIAVRGMGYNMASKFAGGPPLTGIPMLTNVGRYGLNAMPPHAKLAAGSVLVSGTMMNQMAKIYDNHRSDKGSLPKEGE